MKPSLKEYIGQCVTTPMLNYEKIEGYFKKVIFPKKKILLQEGEVCRFEGFVLKGCLKTYFIDENGFEVILTFASENWWVSDLVSFHEKVPSKFNIETIEECELLLLTRENKEKLLEQFPELERMFRLMVQKHLGSYQQRIFNNIALTAEERYEIFLQKYANLQQRIPQYLIASYLGISPEFLSRIRNKKAK